MAFWDIYGKRPSVAELRVKAAKVTEKLKKSAEVSPVVIEGRQIATTFWGKSWCTNLESYQDFSYRLDRGRSYVRHGAVVDLQIAQGKISAQVSGSELYKCKIEVAPLPEERWVALQRACSGKVGSLLELLQGRLSKEVMEVLCKRPGGVFPEPGEIKFQCSCLDWASMCKHIAAVLYGVGNRLDKDPSIFFLLRSVKEQDLIGKASIDGLLETTLKVGQALSDDLTAIFGVEFVEDESKEAPAKIAKEPAKPVKVKATSKTPKAKTTKPAKKPAVKKKPTKRASAKPAKPAKKITAKTTKAKAKKS